MKSPTSHKQRKENEKTWQKSDPMDFHFVKRPFRKNYWLCVKEFNRENRGRIK